MKTKYTTAELPHIYAHSRAPMGSAPASVSFDGDLYFSYATAICRRVRNKSGAVAYILNVSGYSSSTAKHQNKLWNALPGCETVFRISGLDRGRYVLDSITGPVLYEHALKEAAACESRALRARKDTVKARETDAAKTWLNRAVEVSQFFGLKKTVDEKTLSKFRQAADSAAKKAAKALVVERKQREALEAERKAEQLANYEAWKAGQYTGYFDTRLFPVAFRLEGAKLETADDAAECQLVSTQGARVPLREAKIAYRFITSRKGQEWRENGETCPVGGYAVQSITPAGIVAGCHRITWAEIERLAPILA